VVTITGLPHPRDVQDFDGWHAAGDLAWLMAEWDGIELRRWADGFLVILFAEPYRFDVIDLALPAFEAARGYLEGEGRGCVREAKRPGRAGKRWPGMGAA
jgi:hypothetical protein